MWGAAWLRKATGDESYLNYIESNREPFGANDNVDEFGWDNKVGGLNVLVSKVSSILPILLTSNLGDEIEINFKYFSKSLVNTRLSRAYQSYVLFFPCT